MTAHVSCVPNHQTGRSTPISFRHSVAMAGNFGYELDITKFTEEEKQYTREQVQYYKSIRGLVQYGDLYRILSPFDSNYVALIYVSKDKREALLFLYKIMNVPNGPLWRLRLEGLKPELNYRIDDSDMVISGEQLMRYGLNEPGELSWGDYNSKIIHLGAVE